MDNNGRSEAPAALRSITRGVAQPAALHLPHAHSEELGFFLAFVGFLFARMSSGEILLYFVRMGMGRQIKEKTLEAIAPGS